MEAFIVAVVKSRMPHRIDGIPPNREIEDLGDKLAAKIVLVGRGAYMLTPDHDEWIGLNKLSRDGEL